jgi:hypothetical protein
MSKSNQSLIKVFVTLSSPPKKKLKVNFNLFRNPLMKLLFLLVAARLKFDLVAAEVVDKVAVFVIVVAGTDQTRSYKMDNFRTTSTLVSRGVQTGVKYPN